MTSPKHYKNLFKDIQQEIVETKECIDDINRSINRLNDRLNSSIKKKGKSYEHPITITKVIDFQEKMKTCFQERLKSLKQKAAALQI